MNTPSNTFKQRLASYIYSNVYPVGYRNDSFSVAVSYPLTPALELKLPIYFDRLKRLRTSGSAATKSAA